MRQLEHLLMQSVKNPDRLMAVFDALALVVQRHRLYTSFASPVPRWMQRIRLESNPFRNDVAEAEQRMDQLRLAVTTLASNTFGGRVVPPMAPQLLLALACLSSIANLQLLHPSLLIALLEALAEGTTHLFALRRDVGCIVLSVAWRDQPNAERRLYVPDPITGALLSMVGADQVRQLLAIAGTGPLKTRHGMLLRVLRKSVAEIFKLVGTLDRALDLGSALRAARTVVYFGVPGGVAAFRSRKCFSHAPSEPALRRLFFGVRMESAGTGVPLPEESAPQLRGTAEVEPEWLTGMRAAFRNSSRKKLTAQLSEIASKYGPPAPCMARFALMLLQQRKLSGKSTKRYSLLIATRLGCKLNGVDPGTLDIDRLEELYSDVLDGDSDAAPGRTGSNGTSQSSIPARKALLLFHRFLQFTSQVDPLRSMGGLLKEKRLLPVDANFITIDEYRLVLAHIGQERTLSDPHLRTALQLLVTMCFWCGLRRKEVMLLRLVDLDAAGHLHVRPYAGHALKTRNSKRSLPAAILLPEDDRAMLEQWAREREKAPKTGSRTLLFSTRDDASKPLDPDYVFSKVSRAMREALGDPSLKIHHLRHSFATLLAARLLPGTERFSRTFLRRHTQTVKWLTDEKAREEFRGRLFGTNSLRRADLQAVAHLMGHSSPATTVEHYVHCLDWVGVPRFRSGKSEHAVEAVRMSQGTSNKRLPGTAQRLPAETLKQQSLFPASGERRRFSLGSELRNLAWFTDTGKLLVRHLGYGDSLEQCSVDLNIPFDLANARVAATVLLSGLPIALKFKSGCVAGAKYPAGLVHTSSIGLAEKIALGLEKLVSRDAALVQRAVTTYVRHIQESNHLVLTGRDWRHAEEDGSRVACFRDVIRFVDRLAVSDLAVQFVGYTVNGRQPDLRRKLKLLGAKAGTSVHWTRSRNQNSDAALHHLGIRIGCSVEKGGLSQVNSSDAFRYVMAIAAICDVWQRLDRQRGTEGSKAGRLGMLSWETNASGHDEVMSPKGSHALDLESGSPQMNMLFESA